MSDQIQVTHDGWTCAYSEELGKWKTIDGDVEADQLADLKRKLDAIKRKEWGPTPAFWGGYRYGEWLLVMVTGDAESLSYRKLREYWVSIDDEGGKKRRRKIEIVNLKADTPENREIIKKAHAEEVAEMQARQRKEAILKTLAPWTPPTKGKTT